MVSADSPGRCLICARIIPKITRRAISLDLEHPIKRMPVNNQQCHTGMKLNSPATATFKTNNKWLSITIIPYYLGICWYNLLNCFKIFLYRLAMLSILVIEVWLGTIQIMATLLFQISYHLVGVTYMDSSEVEEMPLTNNCYTFSVDFNCRPILVS